MRPLLLVSGTVLSYGIAWLIGVPALVPVLNTLPAFAFLFLALRDESVRRAVALMLLWAATMAITATVFSYGSPVVSGRLFIHGDAYRREMFAWVLTGVGAESDPARFVPTHVLHASLFCVLSLASGAVLSMPMGALLMNYMGHFVGTLAAVSHNHLATAVAAWVPWSVVRVASYVTLGVVLAGPVLSRIGGFAYRLRDHLGVLALGFAGLLADIVMKAALAPHWQRMLRALVGW